MANRFLIDVKNRQSISQGLRLRWLLKITKVDELISKITDILSGELGGKYLS
jgi:hypothetical protein